MIKAIQSIIVAYRSDFQTVLLFCFNQLNCFVSIYDSLKVWLGACSFELLDLVAFFVFFGMQVALLTFVSCNRKDYVCLRWNM